MTGRPYGTLRLVKGSPPHVATLTKTADLAFTNFANGLVAGPEAAR